MATVLEAALVAGVGFTVGSAFAVYLLDKLFPAPSPSPSPVATTTGRVVSRIASTSQDVPTQIVVSTPIGEQVQLSEGGLDTLFNKLPVAIF